MPGVTLVLGERSLKIGISSLSPTDTEPETPIFFYLIFELDQTWDTVNKMEPNGDRKEVGKRAVAVLDT